MRVPVLRWRERIQVRLVMLLPRSLVYWAAMRMLSEHVKQPGLPTMSRVRRAAFVGHLRMEHVMDEFAARRT